MSVVSALSLVGCNLSPQEPADADALDETPEPIDLPLALLRRLHEIGDLIEAKFPNAKGDSGMGKLGLMLSRKLRNGGYFCTPTNSLEFGRTGGNGVHFSLVQVNGTVTENSPVVMTVPACPDNAIVGSSLISFLRFGLLRGYFAMEQLVYRRNLTLKVYSSAEWQPTEQTHYSVGFGVSETKKQIMQLVASELNVSPLGYTASEFESLQNEYMPMLHLKAF